MARRKSSPIEDIFEITASLPWWVGAILAPLSYAILHHYAIAAVPTTAVPGQIGHMVAGQLTKTFASIGQYLLPVVFLLAALTSFFKRVKRQNLALTTRGSINTIRSLSWRDFELLVGEAFRMKGYSVTETGGNGADGGIDLMLKKEGEVFLVQCKQWRAFKVSVNIVRELFGVMAAHGATGGFVVTSGVFTDEASSFAKGRNIVLIDGVELAEMISHVKSSRSNQPHTESQPKPLFNARPQVLCPVCGGSMVRRIANKGPNKGNEFWGCAQFPRCRGVRSNLK
jgi:restriction system protein